MHIPTDKRDRINDVNVSTPGRICLFGEHQDYLGLPVIPAAISLRISLHARRRGDRQVEIGLPDIASRESFSLQGPVPYRTERDYLRSAVNVLSRHGFTFAGGVECTVHGSIPINAGTSSSSALVVSWVHVLSQLSDQASRLSPEQLARYAHESEVEEFGEPGGMMDHYSTAFGGVLFLRFQPQLTVEILEADVKTFVLGDSGEPKDTKAILARTKNRVLDIVKQLSSIDRTFSLRDLTDETVGSWESRLDAQQFALLKGTVRNHSITMHARELLLHQPLDHHRLGDLLNEHHAILRSVLHISTPKIDRMLDAAMHAGAYGGKINGSGGGGCMFVYAPGNPQRVAEAIGRAGGKAYIVAVAEGARNDDVGGE